MKIFEKLNSIRAYQRTHLQFLESLEDYDIVCEIGAAQEAGKFMTAKQLLLCGVRREGGMGLVDVNSVFYGGGRIRSC